MSEQHSVAPTSEQPQVEYRDVPGFLGYRVGSDGSVWSCRCRSGRGLRLTWRQRKPSWIGRYLGLSLMRDNRKVRWSLHSLILTVFVCPRPEGLLALHKDDDRTNNKLANLYWGTSSDNAKDCVASGHAVFLRRGAESINAKLTEEQVLEIRRRRRTGEPCKLIAADFGVCADLVNGICTGKRWKHIAVNDGGRIVVKSTAVVGFALMSKERRAEVAAKAGQKARELGTAHTFTHEERSRGIAKSLKVRTKKG